MEPMAPHKIVYRVLSSNPVLRGAPESALRALAARAVVRQVKAGQVLCGRTLPTGQVWFVSQGLLHATIHSKSGSPVTVDVLRPGEAYGYLSCWTGHNGHDEDVAGLVPAEVVGVPAARFLEFVESHQRATHALLQDTAERVRALMSLRALSTEPAGQRVRSVLAFLHDKLGPRIPMTRAMIATVAGLTTETVSRSMAPLSRRGVIALRRGMVEILDRSRL